MKDLVCKVGEDKNGKPIWKKIGALLNKDGKEFILLDRTFNPAGVVSDMGRSSIMITLHEPKQRQTTQTPSEALGFDNEMPFGL